MRDSRNSCEGNFTNLLVVGVVVVRPGREAWTEAADAVVSPRGVEGGLVIAAAVVIVVIVGVVL